MQGADVQAAQHLLAAKGFPCAPDGIYGPETGQACVNAKVALKYPKAQRQPTCGQALVDALEQHAPFPLPPVAKPRVRYVAQLRAFIADHANWDYAQVRPIPHPPHHGRVVTDCSGAVTYGAECARVSDPNGFGFNGQGYTGSLYSHCVHISRSMLLPGDLVGFGAFPGHHVGAVLEIGSDPLLFSHGHQTDPKAVLLSVEAAAQAASGHPGLYYLRWLI
jgi:hypothetical protein